MVGNKKIMKLGIHIEIEKNKVRRRFTEDWLNSGLINTDALPDTIDEIIRSDAGSQRYFEIIQEGAIPKIVKSIIEQKKSMVGYIEQLHDKIDELLKKRKK